MEKDKEKHLHWMENENEIVLINKRLKLYQMEFHDKNSSISNNIILISFLKNVIAHFYKCAMTGLALSLDQKNKIQ